ncbi:MAG: hypothetical protein LBL73_03595 [Synergistaceae bacterium]|jgi:hypothetical protein|nr:hypothetical protein [Synergistaceae bacterium]
MSSDKKKQGNVIVPKNHPNPPEGHEVNAALIVAEHYGNTAEFIIPTDDYKRSTLDIIMDGIMWEIKSPVGFSKKHTVKEQFERATKQGARNLIFDGRRTKLPDDFLVGAIKHELGIRHRIRRVIFISKKGIVIEIP